MPEIASDGIQVIDVTDFSTRIANLFRLGVSGNAKRGRRRGLPATAQTRTALLGRAAARADEGERTGRGGEGDGNQRLVRLSALDRRHGTAGLSLPDALDAGPEHPADDGIASIDDAHGATLPAPLRRLTS